MSRDIERLVLNIKKFISKYRKGEYFLKSHILNGNIFVKFWRKKIGVGPLVSREIKSLIFSLLWKNLKNLFLNIAKGNIF